MTVEEFYRYCLVAGAAHCQMLVYEPCECRDVAVKPCDIEIGLTCVVVSADVDNHYEDDEEEEAGVEESTSAAYNWYDRYGV